MDAQTTTQGTAAQQIGTASLIQTSQGLIIQGYANSVLEQPLVDFSYNKNLLKYQDEINGGLKNAQAHAKFYLNTVQPCIITNITNIDNYYALHNAVLVTLPEGSSEKDWLDGLRALESESKKNKQSANEVTNLLKVLHTNLTGDTAAFARIVIDLNAAVNGDQGELQSLDQELSSIDGKINGAIAGAVVSGLAIGGGVAMIVVGGFTELVTGGMSTALVIGGVAVLAIGVGGETASIMALCNLNDQKASILQQKSSLSSEVLLAQGCSTAYTSLKKQVEAAVDASQAMENAWEFLSSNLGNLINDLDKGILSTGKLREIFLTAANTEIQKVVGDIGTIKLQMAGVKTVVAQPGQTLNDAILLAVQSWQSPAELAA